MTSATAFQHVKFGDFCAARRSTHILHQNTYYRNRWMLSERAGRSAVQNTIRNEIYVDRNVWTFLLPEFLKTSNGWIPPEILGILEELWGGKKVGGNGIYFFPGSVGAGKKRKSESAESKIFISHFPVSEPAHGGTVKANPVLCKRTPVCFLIRSHLRSGVRRSISVFFNRYYSGMRPLKRRRSVRGCQRALQLTISRRRASRTSE